MKPGTEFQVTFDGHAGVRRVGWIRLAESSAQGWPGDAVLGVLDAIGAERLSFARRMARALAWPGAFVARASSHSSLLARLRVPDALRSGVSRSVVA